MPTLWLQIHLTNSNWHYKVKFVFDKYTIMTRRQSSLEEHLIMKILCYAPLIFHIKELKNIRPNIRKILGHLYLYQILKIIGVYLYSEYLVNHWWFYGLWFGLHDLCRPFSFLLKSLMSTEASGMLKYHIEAI